MPIPELVKLIGERLVEIEDVTDLGEKYKDVLVVKVITAEKLEGSDHLSLTTIDDGGVTKDIERDGNGYIQVVCGAPNIKSGQLVAWLPPESIVPDTFGKPEPFKLGIRNLRGKISNGMIASSRELGLSDEHEGILVLDDDKAPGTPFASAYELDDYLFNIENKSLTHRPDCFGIIGFAREVAVISGKEFVTPDWLNQLSSDFTVDSTEAELSVIIDDAKLCSRYLGVVMSGANGHKKSPLQIQTYLSRVGVRPISAVVDVTNYLMMLTGQPLHAFDYDKLIALNNSKAEIHVRVGRDREKLDLLDGRTIELTPGDIVIASGETAVGLAGAMGGANTVIDENTSRIIIESATFNLYNMRSTQMRHGIFSESITRFTKGQPAELSAPVLIMAIKLMDEWSDAKVVSSMVDTYPGKIERPTIKVPQELINGTLGCDLGMLQITQTLGWAEFDVDVEAPYTVIARPPFWRADIHIPEDIIEEVGRLNGFDNIAPKLPGRDFTAVKPDDFDDFRTKLRKILVRAGANEGLTYSFIHGDVITKSGQDVVNSYRIVNSISPDLQYYRQTLTPSLLELINLNIRQGFDNFALFEINKAHQKSDGLTDEKVPVETDMLSLIVANKNQQIGAMYYQAKQMLDYLAKLIGIELSYGPLVSKSDSALTAPFEYRRAALVSEKTTGKQIGVVGEYKKSVVNAFKLPKCTAGFEINTRTLFETAMAMVNSYKPLSRYPATERDICFRVAQTVNYRQIFDASSSALQNVKLETQISPVDIYQPATGQTKNVTIRVKLTASDHTLSSEEVANVIDAISRSVVSATEATVI
jgi:phenylalanyl-tRNA synthetase beta chain